jgi:hypothetical protein
LHLHGVGTQHSQHFILYLLGSLEQHLLEMQTQTKTNDSNNRISSHDLFHGYNRVISNTEVTRITVLFILLVANNSINTFRVKLI